MQINKKKSIKEKIINFLYLSGIFIFSLAVTTQALARKVNTFQTMTSPIFFYVHKQKISVAATVDGQVDKVLISPGEHVNKGNLIAKLDMNNYNKKVEALAAVANHNLSAQTELNVLKEKKESFNIYAPQSGIIYKIKVAEGSYVTPGTEVAVIFADKEAELITYVSPSQYAELQNKANINVYSQRLKQSFPIKLAGIRKVTDDSESTGNTKKKTRKYELIFHFARPEDGAVFIEQESLQLVNNTSSNRIQRPTEKITHLWNALILGR